MSVTLLLHNNRPAVELLSRGKPVIYMLDRLAAPPPGLHWVKTLW